MARIEFEDKGLGEHADWMLARPDMAIAMGKMSAAVYATSTLGQRERERVAAEFAPLFALDHPAMARLGSLV